MKIYKVDTSSKVVMVMFGIFFILLTLWTYSLDKEAHNSYKLFYYIIGILIFSIFSAGGTHCLHRLRIKIDDEEIELFYLKSAKKTSLRWGEIKELQANYILYPESPVIILIPFEGLNKKKIEFLMQGLPLDLLRDILKYLPSHTKVNLYTYLEKLLQRKPDSKRKVIIITVILIFTILSGFLLTQFKLDDAAIILSIVVLIGIAITTSIWHK